MLLFTSYVSLLLLCHVRVHVRSHVRCTGGSHKNLNPTPTGAAGSRISYHPQDYHNSSIVPPSYRYRIASDLYQLSFSALPLGRSGSSLQKTSKPLLQFLIRRLQTTTILQTYPGRTMTSLLLGRYLSSGRSILRLPPLRRSKQLRPLRGSALIQQT